MIDLLKRGAFAVIGMVVVLAWWTIRGGGGGDEASKVPSRVFDGTQGPFSIALENDQPAELITRFSQGHGDARRGVAAREYLQPGKHVFRVLVPEKCGAYVNLEVPNPKPGAKLSWTISLGPKTIVEEKDELVGELPAGTAFFLQFEVNDIAETAERVR